MAEDVRRAREDAGISQRALSRAAGASSATVSALERGTYDPATEVQARVGEALGTGLGVRFFPGTDPLLRDHVQAATVEALLREQHVRWSPTAEVWVTRPVRGVIDLALEPADAREPLVATEAQSELRRLERQIRWAQAKAAALEQARVRSVSRRLLLRNTRRTRTVVAEHTRSMAIAYPVPAAEAYAALTDDLPWPGPALLWVDLDRGRARIRSTPPRNITVGR